MNFTIVDISTSTRFIVILSFGLSSAKTNPDDKIRRQKTEDRRQKMENVLFIFIRTNPSPSLLPSGERIKVRGVLLKSLS